MQWFLDNLLPEIIGIVLTVFLVDKVIQKREDAKWLPSKNYLYSRLISHFDEVMWATFPFMMSGTKYIYEFGDAVATTLDVNVEFSNTETTNELWSKMNKYISEVSLEKIVVKLERLSREKEEIDKILASSIPLIEPSLSSELMRLQEVLSGATGYIGALHLEEKLQPTGFEIAVFMYRVVASTSKAKTWVLSKATNKRSTDEFILELVEMAKKQEGSRSKNG